MDFKMMKISFCERMADNVVTADSKIYILGGTSGSVQNSVEEYDPTTNTWSTKTAIPYGGLTEHACVTVNNKIYLIGGEPSGGNKTNTLYVYNPSFDTD